MRKELGEQFLKELEPFKEKRLVITGHGNTDVDSYVSMVLLSNILNQLGFNSKPILIYRKIDKTTLNYLNSMGIGAFDDFIVEEEDLIILVDHNSPVESFGLEYYHKGRIVGVIDHHLNIGFSYKAEAIRKYGSTASLIYNMFSEILDLSDYKSMVLKTLLIDTIGLLSEKASEDDHKFAQRLCQELDLDFEILKKWSIFETELNSPPEEILTNGIKEHLIKNKRYASSYIESFFKGPGEREKLFEVLAHLRKHLRNHILIVKDFTNNDTSVYGIINGKDISLKYEGLKSRNNIIKMLFDIKEKDV